MEQSNDDELENNEKQPTITVIKQQQQNQFKASLQDIIKILRSNTQLLQQEKNNYSAEKLMMLLDNEKLTALEEEFNEHPTGIELHNFIWLMKCAIAHPVSEQYELVNGLIKLFQEIDINGDGHMEWSEFTQYIIDAVVGKGDTKFFDGNQQYMCYLKYKIARFEQDREFTEAEVLDKAYANRSKRYIPSKMIDSSLHQNIIKKTTYSLEQDMIYVLEQGSKMLKIYYAEQLTKEQLLAQNDKFGANILQEQVQKQQQKTQTYDYQTKESLVPPFEEKGEKAFILDFSIQQSEAGKPGIIGCLSSDRQFFFFELQGNNRMLKSFKTDVLQTNIWYLKQYKTWITAGADFNLRTWNWNLFEGAKLEEIINLNAHTKPISEVLEICAPKLLASASLDGRIILWDLIEKVAVTELKDPFQASRGIRGMTYSYDFGGNLISYGFENYLNVWCPEVSLTRSFIGKLEGHNSIVVCCKFITNNPNCISIDEKTNIRIWDIRTLSPIQVISSDVGQVIVSDLAIISKHDRFVLAGKRLLTFDNSALASNLKAQTDEICAIQVDFNSYYNQFVILTKIDIRIYDALTGKLKKVFANIQDKNVEDLTNFCFGSRQRKIYVSDNMGNIRVFNVHNGELMKSVTMNENQGGEFSSILKMKKNDQQNQEISGTIFLSHEKLLITSSWDSTIRIYDEEDPEESKLIKLLAGGHENSEITAMTYSEQYFYIATGSVNGLVSVWDCETGKLDFTFFQIKSDVVCLQFALYFPILLVGQSSGLISVCVVHDKHTTLKPQILFNIQNVAYIQNEWIFSGIYAMQILTQTAEGIPTDRSIRDRYFNSYTKWEGVYPKLKQKKKKIFKLGEKKQKQDSEETEENEPQRPAEWETPEQFLFLMKQHDQLISAKKKRCYVYYGDNAGYINLINLTELLNKRKINPQISDELKQMSSFTLKRRDIIDATKTVESKRAEEQNKIQTDIQTFYPYESVLLKRWKAHKTGIISITKLADPISLISTSYDKHVRIWSKVGELYGDINLAVVGTTIWNFPFDWVKQKLDEMEFVFQTMKLLEKQSLTQNQKEEIQMNFLINKFFKNMQHVEYEYNQLQEIEQRLGAEKKRKKMPTIINAENLQLEDQFQMKEQMRIDTEEEQNISLSSQDNLDENQEEEEGSVTEKDLKRFKKTDQVIQQTIKQKQKQLDIQKSQEQQKFIAFDISKIKNKLNEQEQEKKRIIEQMRIRKEELLSQMKFSQQIKEEQEKYQIPFIYANQNNKKLNNQKYLANLWQKIDSYETQTEWGRTRQSFYNNINQQKQGKKKKLKMDLGQKSPLKQQEVSVMPSTIQHGMKSFPASQEKWKLKQQQQIRQELPSLKIKQKRAQTSEGKNQFPFASITAQSFLKNANRVSNIIKQASSTIHNFKDPSQFDSNKLDIRFRTGEALRTLKLAAFNQEMRFESESQTLYCNDNQILQNKKKFYQELHGALKTKKEKKQDTKVEVKNEENEKLEGLSQLSENSDQLSAMGGYTKTVKTTQTQFKKPQPQKKGYIAADNLQVIASKSFYSNPKKTDPKILKAAKKLYVL